MKTKINPEKINVELSPEDYDTLQKVKSATNLMYEKPVRVKVLSTLSMCCPPLNADEKTKAQYIAKRQMSRGITGSEPWKNCPPGVIIDLPESMVPRLEKMEVIKRVSSKIHRKCTPVEEWQKYRAQLRKESQWLDKKKRIESAPGLGGKPYLLKELDAINRKLRGKNLLITEMINIKRRKLEKCGIDPNTQDVANPERSDLVEGYGAKAGREVE